MTMPIGRRSLLYLAPPLLAGACSSPDPALYTIQMKPGEALAGGPKVVQLRDIALANYLDRKEIVRSAQDYKLAVMQNNWWGEDLGRMLGRVIAMGLAQRLPGSQVVSEGGAVPADPDAVAGVNIQRLDLDNAGQLLLAAQAGIEFYRSRRNTSRAFQITRTPAGPDTRALVAAISDAVGELTDGLAQMLRA
jgi:uncharacterized lipoprotein YmbA